MVLLCIFDSFYDYSLWHPSAMHEYIRLQWYGSFHFHFTASLICQLPITLCLFSTFSFSSLLIPPSPQKGEIDFQLKNNLSMITFWPWVEIVVTNGTCLPRVDQGGGKLKTAQWKKRWKAYRSTPALPCAGLARLAEVHAFAHIRALITVAKAMMVFFIGWWGRRWPGKMITLVIGYTGTPTTNRLERSDAS